MKHYREEGIIAAPFAHAACLPFALMSRKWFKVEPGVDAQVMQLARKGLTVAEISQRMQLGTRIIEYILNARTVAGALVLPPIPPKTN